MATFTDGTLDKNFAIITPFYSIFVIFQNLGFEISFRSYWKRGEGQIGFDGTMTSTKIPSQFKPGVPDGIEKAIYGSWGEFICILK